MTRLGSIGDYLIAQLSAHGVGHVFGVPGGYVLGVYDLLARSDLHVVNTCDER
jgi:indolepyruvate decarboxylase